MPFDWPNFLQTRGIEYVDRGPSTAKGNVYVHCPMCGGADRGHHMGIALDGRGWGCWKSSAHRGRAPERLIQALIGCSWAEAAEIAGKGASSLDFGSGGILTKVQGLVGSPPCENLALSLPKTFQRLDHASGHAITVFWGYLERRGFDDDQIEVLCEKFDLRFSSIGDSWAYRVILPIYNDLGILQTWTGRAVNSDAKAKYKTLSTKPGADQWIALAPSSDLLLDMPGLFANAGDFLILCEGPFDAMRVACFLEPYDAQVTCLFGKVVSPSQMDYLARLRPYYDKVFLLLDPEASLDALVMAGSLAALDITPIYLQGNRDPGEMRESEIERLLDRLYKMTRT